MDILHDTDRKAAEKVDEGQKLEIYTNKNEILVEHFILAEPLPESPSAAY